MLLLIPARLHRALLRVAFRVRGWLRRWLKPRLAGVGVVLRNDAGDVLLVRHSYGSGRWSLPGGGCGRHEDPAHTARREMREELAIAIQDLRLIARTDETIDGSPHTAWIYEARIIGTPKPDRREVVEARFFAPGALPEDIGALTRQRLALVARPPG